jgi:hypothetical protein
VRLTLDNGHIGHLERNGNLRRVASLGVGGGVKGPF